MTVTPNRVRSIYMDFPHGTQRFPSRGDRISTGRTLYWVMASRMVKRKAENANPRVTLAVITATDLQDDLKGRLLRSAMRRDGSLLFSLRWYPRRKKMTKHTWIALVFILLLAHSGAQSARYGKDGAYALPDARVTPGAVDSSLIADTTGKPHMVSGVEHNLCAKDFRTGPFRKVSQSEKKKSCAAYGITSGCPGPGYELDHLISLEIGGSDDITNLWPQPIKEARIKDHGTEDPLPKLVCSGKISLKDAQSCVSHDWVKCMAKVKELSK